jgi:uncharacterized protein (TIGR00297 family)
VLSTGGAVAGALFGTLAVAVGWSWGILLFAHFLVASALSKIGERRKAELVGGIVEKGDRRDANQVFANGALYVIAGVAWMITASPSWYAMGIGALAASAADTWATEIGTLAGGVPVFITTGKRVPAGTSGGITLSGSVASIGGALFVALAAAFAGWPVPFTAIVLGGIAGAVADSVIGATLQTRRWCDVCSRGTERLVHDCGELTRRAGGIPGFGNDAVNAACSAVGALVTLLLS